MLGQSEIKKTIEATVTKKRIFFEKTRFQASIGICKHRCYLKMIIKSLEHFLLFVFY